MNKDDNIVFSIIIPTYNRAHLIAGTLDSFQKQNCKDYEVLIIDDGSTDNTYELVQPYLSDRILYFKKNNAERAAARNYGTVRARGKYINWFDSDDIMMPEHLRRATANIEMFDHPEVFTHGFLYQDGSGKVYNQSDYSSDIRSILYRGNPLAVGGVFVRRDIALLNMFNEDRGLSGSEDYELWLRLGARYEIFACSDISVLFIFHSERSTIVMSDSVVLIGRYTKLILYAGADPAVSNLLNGHMRFFKMKNYLLLAVDLANNKEIRLGLKYLLQGFINSPKIIFERGFYAFIKHTGRYVLSHNNDSFKN